jgi:diguanylate cyclase (GGDEF)-like protein/PAS domain S-box-containing protein
MRNQAEANLSALIESTEDLIWSVDLEFRLIAYNRALAKTLKRNRNVTVELGKSADDMLPPELAGYLNGLFQRALAEGSYRTEYTLLDGRILELALNPIVIDGKATGVSVFGKDITERKKALDALQHADKKYRDIFDGAVEGMFQTSIEGQLLTANVALAKMLGFDSPEEILSSTTIMVQDAWVDPDHRAELLRQLEKNGAVHGLECRFNRRGGSPIWVSLSARRVCDAEGRALYLEGFIEDISERKQAEIELRDSEARFRDTFEQAAVGIVHTSFEGTFLRCNPRFAEIVGYPQDEVPGKTFYEITPPGHLAESVDVLEQLVQGKADSAGWEKCYIRKDGSLTWVRMTTSTQRDGEGRPLHLVAFVEDINDRIAAEERSAAAAQALQVSEARYRTVFQTSLDPLILTRLSDGMVIDVNQAFLDILGFEYEEVVGHSTLEIKIWADHHDRQKLVDILNKDSICRDSEARFRKKNGEILWVLTSSSVIEIDGVSYLLGYFRDLSGAKAAEEQIRDLAFYDPLTHLPNRRLLSDRLRQVLAAGPRHSRNQALLLIDLDNFKTLNNTEGHIKGDLLLQEVARRIVASVSEGDTVARIGGDEFVAIIENLSDKSEDAAAQAEAIGEKILSALGQPCLLDGYECICSASIGITVFGNKKESANDLLQQADLAMHQAKAVGRNTIRFFAPELQAAVSARSAMEEDLRKAIKTNKFQLYYQPQVENGRLIGAEALVRWKHPKRGLLSPEEFISMAEETGLILPLGDWVLKAACKQIAAWARHKDSAQIVLAVNISARQLLQPDFVNKVLTILNSSGANPENLKLEITESSLLENIEEVIATMTELKSHGLRFSLDDFGTGYSSLSYLKRLPLDQLKIDRLFVRDILADAASGAIARTIISLSHAMGLSVVAEGVETEAQRDYLASLGCPAFQGYLYSKPLPLEEFQLLLPNFAESAVPAA